MDLPQKTNAAFVGPRDVKLCDTATTTILNTGRLAQVYVAHDTLRIQHHHTTRKERWSHRSRHQEKGLPHKKLFVYDGDDRFIYFPAPYLRPNSHRNTGATSTLCINGQNNDLRPIN